MLSEYDKALLDAALDKLGINSAYECLTRCDYDMTIRDAWLSCDRRSSDYRAAGRRWPHGSPCGTDC